MKETGILYTPDNIRAIMNDLKTQTRRVANPQPNPTERQYDFTRVEQFGHWFHIMADKPEPIMCTITCPYGVPGDRLYVKEGWGIGGARLIDPTVNYRAGGQMPLIGHSSPDTRSIHGNRHGVNDADLMAMKDGWHNAMFMPKWAARTWLEITEVRVERLQDISRQDSMAEGIVQCDIPADEEGPRRIGYMAGPDDGKSGLEVTPQDAYRKLWDSINGKKHPWKNNDWVWALTFRRVTP